MFDVSQTIVQLYRQLLGQEFTAAEIQRVAAMYHYMMELCGNRFRASGKPFMDHLVGVASIAAHYRHDIVLVVAALAHSVYDEADFGSFWPKITRRNKRELRRELGHDVDTLTRLYSEFEWKPQTVATIPQRLASMTGTERDVVFLRVANELEEAINLDLLFYENVRRQKKLALLNACSDIADGLGYPAMAREVREAYVVLVHADVAGMPVPEHAYSFIVTPRSDRKRLSPLLGRYFYRFRKRLYNALKQGEAKAGDETGHANTAK